MPLTSLQMVKIRNLVSSLCLVGIFTFLLQLETLDLVDISSILSFVLLIEAYMMAAMNVKKVGDRQSSKMLKYIQ